ncbi:MAG: nuclear transport factor 2 family protein [Bacteroidota bacterium]
MRIMLTIFLTTLLLVSCTNSEKGKTTNPEKQEKEIVIAQINQKEALRKGMDALFRNFSESEMRTYYKEDYIQHNPNVSTGLNAVIGLLNPLRESGFGYTTHRMIEDDDLILTHTIYTNAMVFSAPTVVAFDIWRMEDGKIAEHWDCIIPKYEETASGRSQTDGFTAVTDLDKTEDNKALVKDFVEQVLMQEDFSKMGDYIKNGLYDQHNPLVGDGPQALQDVIAVSGLKNNKMHRVIGEGNFVLTQCEGTWNGKPQAIYDLFRVDKGAIVEHWDVIQEIPEEMAHDNSMF